MRKTLIIICRDRNDTNSARLALSEKGVKYSVACDSNCVVYLVTESMGLLLAKCVKNRLNEEAERFGANFEVLTLS